MTQLEIHQQLSMQTEVAQTDTIALEFPADHRYLNVVSACIAEVLERVEGLPGSPVIINNLQLAVHEACANIVRHAYAGCADGRIKTKLTLQGDPRRLIIDLHDTGQSFDPNQVPKPNIGTPQEHGYGLFLMETLLDEVEYDSVMGQNHWRLVKNL